MIAPLVIVAGTFVSYLVGVAIGSRPLLPILNVLPAYPYLIGRLRAGRVGEALLLMLGWALALAVFATTMGYARPERSGAAIFHAREYRQEMLAWVLTGEGRENRPREFIPEQAVHALVFVAASLATAGAASMVMGAALMNYMGYYAGGLARMSNHPLLAACLAWQPWAILRIISFVALGVVLAGPLVGRLTKTRFALRRYQRWMVLAVMGLLADILLKTALAPAWSQMLRGLL